MHERPTRDRLKTRVVNESVTGRAIMTNRPFDVAFTEEDGITVGCLAGSLLEGRPPETTVAFRIDGWTFGGTVNRTGDGEPMIEVWESGDGDRVKGEKGVVLLPDETEVHAASWRRQRLARTALNLAFTCVRNTVLEDLHAGVDPSGLSATGDGTDVAITGPNGSTTLDRMGRQFDDGAMKDLMKEVSDKLYTYLLVLEEDAGKGLLARRFLDARGVGGTQAWDTPSIDVEMLSLAMMVGTRLDDEGVDMDVDGVRDDLADLDVADVEPMDMATLRKEAR